jgi:hypothetical protein
MCRTHYHAERRTILVRNSVQTPGPGNYRMPSDFGFYEAKKKFEPAPEQRASSGNPISRMAKSAS